MSDVYAQLRQALRDENERLSEELQNCAYIRLRLATEKRRAIQLLRALVNDLPTNRDWLDPAWERAARAFLAKQETKDE